MDIDSSSTSETAALLWVIQLEIMSEDRCKMLVQLIYHIFNDMIQLMNTIHLWRLVFVKHLPKYTKLGAESRLVT